MIEEKQQTQQTQNKKQNTKQKREKIMKGIFNKELQ